MSQLERPRFVRSRLFPVASQARIQVAPCPWWCPQWFYRWTLSRIRIVYTPRPASPIAVMTQALARLQQIYDPRVPTEVRMLIIDAAEDLARELKMAYRRPHTWGGHEGPP